MTALGLDRREAAEGGAQANSCIVPIPFTPLARVPTLRGVMTVRLVRSFPQIVKRGREP